MGRGKALRAYASQSKVQRGWRQDANNPPRWSRSLEPRALVGFRHGEQECRIFFGFQTMQAVRNDQQIPGLAFPRVLAGPQAKATLQDKDGGVARVLMIAQARASFESHDSLPEHLLMPAVHSVSGSTGAGCNGGGQLLASQGFDRNFLHEPTVPTIGPPEDG